MSPLVMSIRAPKVCQPSQNRSDWGDQIQVDKTVTTVNATPVRELPSDTRRKLRIALESMPDEAEGAPDA